MMRRNSSLVSRAAVAALNVVRGVRGAACWFCSCCLFERLTLFELPIMFDGWVVAVGKMGVYYVPGWDHGTFERIEWMLVLTSRRCRLRLKFRCLAKQRWQEKKEVDEVYVLTRLQPDPGTTSDDKHD
jgi:hypothetical protein